MRRRADGLPAMLGESLLIQARSSADLQHFPPEDFEGRIELGNAEFPDLVFVNDLIPEGAGLVVKGGRGSSMFVVVDLTPPFGGKGAHSCNGC